MKKLFCRRDALIVALRYAVLAVLTALGCFAAFKRRAAAGDCLNHGLCNGCVAFADCDRPLAVSLKNSRKEV